MPGGGSFRDTVAAIGDYRLYDESGNEYVVQANILVSAALMTMSAQLNAPTISGAAIIAAGLNTATALLQSPRIIAFGRRRLFGCTN